MNPELINVNELHLGAALEGGIYIGSINVNGTLKGILLPPKSVRQYPELIAWNESYDFVEGAVSFCDGHSNTVAMAKAGSRLAQWALDNNMHIPSLDELEIDYRHGKPTAQENYLYGRAGINVSAVPPTYPYTKDDPKQTTLEQFRAGNAEAFDTHDWYWTSTQPPGGRGCAYAQGFSNGDQGGVSKDTKCLGCAVRWIEL